MSDAEQVFKVRTSDGIDFDVNLKVAEQIGLIQGWLQQEQIENSSQCSDDDNIVFLDRVRSEIFKLVLMWCIKLLEIPVSTLILEDNDHKINLFKTILEQAEADDSVMFELIIAADFLNVESLYHAGANYVAGLIAACDSVQKIRERFHIIACDDSD